VTRNAVAAPTTIAEVREKASIWALKAGISYLRRIRLRRRKLLKTRSLTTEQLVCLVVVLDVVATEAATMVDRLVLMVGRTLHHVHLLKQVICPSLGKSARAVDQ